MDFVTACAYTGVTDSKRRLAWRDGGWYSIPEVSMPFVPGMWIAGAMSREIYSDELVRTTLQTNHTIALVGASANPTRPSYGVLEWLLRVGYRVFPVNPGLDGKRICNALVYARLADIPEPVDMVDVFRNSEAAAQTIDEALELNPLPKTIWMQLGVHNERAAARAQARGVTVIQNRCPKIESARLGLHRTDRDF